MRLYRFTVYGRPIPKPRMTTGSKWSPAATRALAYQERVASEIKAKWLAVYKDLEQITEPVALYIEVHRAARQGDTINFVKSVEDGIQRSGIIANDKQVAKIFTVRHTDKECPKVIIGITPDVVEMQLVPVTQHYANGEQEYEAANKRHHDNALPRVPQ